MSGGDDAITPTVPATRYAPAPSGASRDRDGDGATPGPGGGSRRRRKRKPSQKRPKPKPDDASEAPDRDDGDAKHVDIRVGAFRIETRERAGRAELADPEGHVAQKGLESTQAAGTSLA